MQLNSNSIERLQQLINVAQISEIDNVIIEDGKIRGISENKTVVLLAEDNIPDFGFPRIGLTRLSTLSSRLGLVKDDANRKIDSKQGKNDTDVGQLDISWPGVKVGYRCADPASIRAPKNVRDIPTWGVTVDSKQIPMIINALKSMGSKKINLNTRTGGAVFLELVDDTSDAFTLQLADGAEYLKDGEPRSRIFVHVYPSTQLISILKAAAEGKDSIQFAIGENGTLQIMLYDTYNLIVISNADSE